MGCPLLAYAPVVTDLNLGGGERLIRQPDVALLAVFVTIKVQFLRRFVLDFRTAAQ